MRLYTEDQLFEICQYVAEKACANSLSERWVKEECKSVGGTVIEIEDEFIKSDVENDVDHIQLTTEKFFIPTVVIDQIIEKQFETYGQGLMENLEQKFHYGKGFGDALVIVSDYFESVENCKNVLKSDVEETAERYLKKNGRLLDFQRAVELNDHHSIYSMMEDFVDNQLSSLKFNLPDHYQGELNTERIKAYRFEAEKWKLHEDSVGKIFCAGADWYKSKCE